MTLPVQPRYGDFCATSVGGASGRLIQLGEWLNGDGFSPFEHVFLYLGNMIRIEADPSGVRVRRMATLNQPNFWWSSATFDLTDTQRTAICEAAQAYLGVGYSSLDYVALAAHRLRIPAPGLRAYIASTKHMICSQFADQCYTDAGVHLFADGRWPGYVTPAEMSALIKTRINRGGEATR